MDMQALSQRMQKGDVFSSREAAAAVVALSIPAILEHLISTVMGYIDSAMVGHLGAASTAAIGVVSSSTWLFGGVMVSFATGFSVQIAQYLGGGRQKEAQGVLRQAMVTNVAVGLLLTLIAVIISPYLPGWLGADKSIWQDASAYFRIFGYSIPLHFALSMYSSILRCSGDTRTPSILNILAGPLDVVFNYLLIYPSSRVSVFGISFTLPGAGLGVTGAALGTTLSTLVVAAIMLTVLLRREGPLKLTPGGSWRITPTCMRNLARIGLPCAGERLAQNGAQVLMMRICASLGVAAIAANSLAVNAEAMCYLPAFGIQAAAVALVGQAMGAGRKDMMKRFGYLSNWLCMGLMVIMGVLLYVLAEPLMTIFTQDEEVIALGAKVLRIEAFAEPLYGASIVITGALRGAGDSTAPFLINLVSMWGIRLPLAALLAPTLGLTGVWTAMCLELCARGIFCLVRMKRGKWLKATALE